MEVALGAAAVVADSVVFEDVLRLLEEVRRDDGCPRGRNFLPTVLDVSVDLPDPDVALVGQRGVDLAGSESLQARALALEPGFDAFPIR